MTDHCTKCGKKIGKTDKAKLKLMARGMVFSDKAREEFESLKGQCPKCIAKFFKPRLKEALGELGDVAVPDRFKGLVKKAKKVVEKE